MDKRTVVAALLAAAEDYEKQAIEQSDANIRAALMHDVATLDAIAERVDKKLKKYAIDPSDFDEFPSDFEGKSLVKYKAGNPDGADINRAIDNQHLLQPLCHMCKGTSIYHDDICPECRGGKIQPSPQKYMKQWWSDEPDPDNPDACTRCDGLGYHRVRGEDEYEYDECPHCKGTGKRQPKGESAVVKQLIKKANFLDSQGKYTESDTVAQSPDVLGDDGANLSGDPQDTEDSNPKSLVHNEIFRTLHTLSQNPNRSPQEDLLFYDLLKQISKASASTPDTSDTSGMSNSQSLNMPPSTSNAVLGNGDDSFPHGVIDFDSNNSNSGMPALNSGNMLSTPGNFPIQ